METIKILDNFFLNSTKSNIKRMAEFLGVTVDKLSSFTSDPVIEGFYNTLLPLRSDFDAIRMVHLVADGEYHSATLILNLALDQITEKLNRWEPRIQIEAPKGGGAYKAIFPSGHTPFHTGDRNSKFLALLAFNRAVQVNAQMVEIQPEIQAYVNDIEFKLRIQNVKKEDVISFSELLETKRVNIAFELYGILGLMMNEYKRDPGQINKYFDFSILKRPANAEEEVFTGFVSGLQTKNVINREFTDKSVVILQNTGTTDLNFCLTSAETTACQDSGVIVNPAQHIKLKVSELGNLNYHCLNVTNLYGSNDGFFAVTLVS